MQTSEATGALTAALIAARAKMPTIHRGGVGQVGSRKYNYATLDDVLAVIVPILCDNGLLLAQGMGTEGLRTRLTHKSGEFVESEPLLIAPDKPGPQGMGAVVTYTRRYQLVSMLGLATGEDTDGVNGHTPAVERPASEAPPIWSPSVSKTHAKRLRDALEKCDNLEDLQRWKRNSADDINRLGPPDKQELVMRATTIHGALKDSAEGAAN